MFTAGLWRGLNRWLWGRRGATGPPASWTASVHLPAVAAERVPVCLLPATGHRVASLLTKAERVFYRSLVLAVDGQFAILAKVRVVDVVEPGEGTGRRAALGILARRHFDFVLATLEDLRPVAAIELDDRSHHCAGRRARDWELDEACRSAGLPLARIAGGRAYEPSEIRRALLRSVTRQEAAK